MKMNHKLLIQLFFLSFLALSCKPRSESSQPDQSSASLDTATGSAVNKTNDVFTDSRTQAEIYQGAILAKVGEFKDAFADYQSKTSGLQPETESDKVLALAAENIQDHSNEEIAEYLLSSDFKELSNQSLDESFAYSLTDQTDEEHKDSKTKKNRKEPSTTQKVLLGTGLALAGVAILGISIDFFKPDLFDRQEKNVAKEVAKQKAFMEKRKRLITTTKTEFAYREAERFLDDFEGKAGALFILSNNDALRKEIGDVAEYSRPKSINYVSASKSYSKYLNIEIDFDKYTSKATSIPDMLKDLFGKKDIMELNIIESKIFNDFKVNLSEYLANPQKTELKAVSIGSLNFAGSNFFVEGKFIHPDLAYKNSSGLVYEEYKSQYGKFLEEIGIDLNKDFSDAKIMKDGILDGKLKSYSAAQKGKWQEFSTNLKYAIQQDLDNLSDFKKVFIADNGKFRTTDELRGKVSDADLETYQRIRGFFPSDDTSTFKQVVTLDDEFKIKPDGRVKPSADLEKNLQTRITKIESKAKLAIEASQVRQAANPNAGFHKFSGALGILAGLGAVATLIPAIALGLTAPTFIQGDNYFNGIDLAKASPAQSLMYRLAQIEQKLKILLP